jgi:transcription antitermination factor NusA-like protein
MGDPMPKGPKGRKRPADVIGAAVQIARIATWEISEDLGETKHGKDKAAVALGRKGGNARAASMTAKQRSEIAKKAAAKRWANSR